MRRLRSVNRKRRSILRDRFASKMLYEIGRDGTPRICCVFDNLHLSGGEEFTVQTDFFRVPVEEFYRQKIKSGTYFKYVVVHKKHVKIQEIKKPYQPKGKRHVLETTNGSHTG